MRKRGGGVRRQKMPCGQPVLRLSLARGQALRKDKRSFGSLVGEDETGLVREYATGGRLAASCGIAQGIAAAHPLRLYRHAGIILLG